MTLTALAARLRESVDNRVRSIVADSSRRNQIRHACTAVTASMLTCLALAWWDTLPRVLADPGIGSVVDLLPKMFFASLVAAGAEFVRLWLDTGIYAYDR
ncbi:hypothetical protein [Bradyrhizobium sp. LB11.1]|uniref:hypothetical protein n=1 Tax=Bradyrhizobium sp. LB11.1 TaxID=3156326 RepID=UPI003391995D